MSKRVPRRREWRRVGQVELFELVNPHPLLQRRGNHIDPPRGAILSDHRSTHDPPRHTIRNQLYSGLRALGK